MSTFASALEKALCASSMWWSAQWGKKKDMNSQFIGQHVVCTSLQQIQK